MSDQRHVSTLTGDLRAIFGDRLQSVGRYGDTAHASSSTALVLVTSFTAADLDACARAAAQWQRLELGTPLILPLDEFQASLDAFPLEYAEMRRTYAPVVGPSPFADAFISRDDLRRACERQAKSHLVHLREGYIESHGTPGAVAALVAASAPAFAALLRSVAGLAGHDSGSRADITRRGADAAGLPDAIVSQVLALEQPDTMASTDAARLFPAYLAAVEQLARTLDRWEA